MPVTYAIKPIISSNDFVWINPTLLLSLFLFPFIRKGWNILLIIALLISIQSSLFGSIYISEDLSLYNIIREPIRFFLVILWFWSCVHFLIKYPIFTIKILSISAILQLCIAVIFLIVFIHSIITFGLDHSLKGKIVPLQIHWLNANPIPRLGGTFGESPPFGLFMFSCFIILYLSITYYKFKSKFIFLGMLCSAIGTIGSLSDQVMIAFSLFIISCFLCSKIKTYRKIFGLLFLCIILSPLMFLLSTNLTNKFNQLVEGKEIYANSSGERMYHIRYGLSLISKDPVKLVTGIGAGLYGYNVAKGGMFPETTNMQVLIADWLVENGAFFFAAMLFFLLIVGIRAYSKFGPIGVVALICLVFANLFQANWKWEAWFFGLAFLYTTILPVQKFFKKDSGKKRDSSDSPELFYCDALKNI